MGRRKIKIQWKPIADIAPYERNAKAHPKTQVERIAASIEAFGFNQPIAVDEGGIIIAGHGRFFAAEKLGLGEVPVVVLDLSDEEAKSYRLADNRLNESQWDMETVRAELDQLPLPLIELAGFSEEELKETINKTREVKFEALVAGLVRCPKCEFRFDPKTKTAKGP